MDELRTKGLFTCKAKYLDRLFGAAEYPWELLPCIKTHLKELVSGGIEGFKVYSDGVLAGENVSISPLATIEPPAVIGRDTVIRPGAYLRGNVIIGEGCVIGNSSELKNCILLDNVQVPHFNYVGDSVLGNNVHIGAGVICSNLKADKKDVCIGKSKIPTGLKKVGAFLADGADIGSGCVLNPGTVVGKRTSVYPLTALRGVYPPDSIVKSVDNIVLRKEKNICAE